MRIVLHVGAVHLSKEKHRDTTINFGWVALPNDNSLGEVIQGASIIELYQEHAVLKIPPEWVSRLHIGDELYILPVHSCLAVDAMVHKNKFVLVE